ncbi:hypothetical protein CEXT_537631 [Caerostris extrusa]|uniref:Uncharacterized protein n=1 Tax=Caerostris extrusa TaxID=172846 RepID=A0AAV4UEI1_CAEEX|nr:hypothetical protein CEXT_537631 [Caerostris extrusa]
MIGPSWYYDWIKIGIMIGPSWYYDWIKVGIMIGPSWYYDWIKDGIKIGLKLLAMEEKYPEPRWTRIFTDGSQIDEIAGRHMSTLSCFPSLHV